MQQGHIMDSEAAKVFVVDVAAATVKNNSLLLHTPVGKPIGKLVSILAGTASMSAKLAAASNFPGCMTQT